MAATVLLIRHAAHDDLNVRLSGRRAGVGLTESGRAQAERLGRHLAPRQIAGVVCSPLDRTVETATPLAHACGLPGPAQEDRLTEIDFGDWTGRTFDSLRDDPAWHHWNLERHRAKPPGGESMAAAQARIIDWLSDMADTAEGATIAAVTHCDIVRAAVAHVLGMSLDKLLRFDIDPASITTVVVGEWGMKLVRLNEKGD
jgi:probable phosphoglycerate mutase